MEKKKKEIGTKGGGENRREKKNIEPLFIMFFTAGAVFAKKKSKLTRIARTLQGGNS